ncbi:hypothetical protein [Sphaerisporangium sp. TRM90804]|uniref:hypothetical protein n=1 Tax=Sphaerisporangium sp. TRM90804 TaxID=3031113 RepID=UPI00244D3E27|nr:hypothetical protein [Sphaerisporangium sp. TRM90804]MDH2424795.1 hypothetical protein [Sphaerisporangium sp. TRM90804]
MLEIPPPSKQPALLYVIDGATTVVDQTLDFGALNGRQRAILRALLAHTGRALDRYEAEVMVGAWEKARDSDA